MKRILITLLVLVSFAGKISADEGMWLPLLIKDRLAHMQELGFRLTAEDLYDINNASLKDAIVHFGGGCTGELISAQGLLITNHHCGYGQIQSHSSVENDYLKDGFWAGSLKDELPNRNLTVRFLIRMEDVTESVLMGYEEGMAEGERARLVSANSASITRQAVENTHYQARVEALYYGNQYFLFVYETFTDVRLVGAPPSSIGKFGGDTDNWMWPRHTGDFALFRIYADKDNKPAPYSEDNVPYVPKKYFKISSKGVSEGDFTLVYGYPGRTFKYLHSDAVKYIAEISNPHKINLRTMRLNVQREEMAKSQEVRIKYSSKNASVSNAWKKWQGESKGIARLNTIENKVKFEQDFEKWTEENTEYKGLITKMAQIYKALLPYAFATDYHNEAIIANEILRFSGSTDALVRRPSNDKESIKESIRTSFEIFYKDYYMPIDKKSFIKIVKQYSESIPVDFQPHYFKEQLNRFGSIDSLAGYIFKNSLFASYERALKALEGNHFDSLVVSDPAVILYRAFNDNFQSNIRPVTDSLNSQLNLLYRTYMRGQMEFDTKREFYPDANSTLRITYGNVMGYKPMDGVYYKPVSTLEGIMEKDNPDIFDYDIPQKLRDVYKSKNYGRWESNGTVPVCFIATNHTSGGNSGSPVINANGELIGINFDRVWEGTMSDIDFDPQMCRNISLDIRFVLFVIEKIAEANHLLDEIEII